MISCGPENFLCIMYVRRLEEKQSNYVKGILPFYLEILEAQKHSLTALCGRGLKQHTVSSPYLKIVMPLFTIWDRILQEVEM